MKREDVELILRHAEMSERQGYLLAQSVPHHLAALCRRWLALDGAQIREVEEEMHGLVIRAHPLKKGQRVRIVPEQGDAGA